MQPGAKLLELRATIHLARLLGSQHKATEARDLLVPIYSWFTEGFSVADMVEAKTPLEELS